MALWVCAGEGGCGTKYAVGLFRCPRCHNTQFFEDGDPMAKITRHGGASDATLPTTDAAAAATDPAPAAAADHSETRVAVDTPAPEPEDAEPPDVTDDLAGPPVPAVEGGEESSPGSSSSASTDPQPTTSEPSSKPTPKRARGTGSRSNRSRTAEGSSAPSTATNGQKTDGTDETSE
jgi:hypothetical protein